MTSDEQPLPRRVGLLGAGVIGSGWAARFLLAGTDVCLFDPAPGAADGALAALERARRAWQRLTPVPAPPEGTLTFATTVEEAVADAELVQESAPEREALKTELLRQADAAAAPDAIIASSTSGLRPSRLVRSMTRPERFVVGHPFNPVYLLPLVEVCGAKPTGPEVVARAAAIYRAAGMHPLVVRHEIDGFIADRLLEALWREALWLVADNVATAEEVDDAIRFAAGLRWAAMGTFLTYRLAGGEAGMRHFMEQFGPTLQLPWSRLTDVPVLDESLLDKLVAQSDAQAAGRSIAELEQVRDDCLVAVLSGLRSQDFGAGATVAQTERRWLAAAPPPGDVTGGQGVLRLHTALVTPDWIDYNGHMTEFRYLQVLADTTDAFLAHIGIDAASAAAGSSYYTVESHLRHLGQAYAGDRLATTTQLLAHDAKRLHLYHQVHRGSGYGEPVASGEHMLIHVDSATGRAAPAGPAVLAALERIAERQDNLIAPDGAGRRIAVGPGG